MEIIFEKNSPREVLAICLKSVKEGIMFFIGGTYAEYIKIIS